MCAIDLEPCEVWRETPRMARKDHVCSCCGADIKPGSTYTDHFSIFERAASQAKLCEPCRADRDAFAEAHGGMKPHPSCFVETLEDCIQDGDDDSEARWKPMLTNVQGRGRASERNTNEC